MAGDLHPSSTHPPLPPTTEDIRFHHLRLLRSSRIGPGTYHRLLAEYGTPQAALDALPGIAAEAGIEDYTPCPEALIASELKTARKLGAHLLLHGFDTYPEALCDLEDAPPALWAIGNLDLLNSPAITILGARSASALGLRMTTAISRELAEAGYVLSAAFTTGIAAAAHKAALRRGSIAVQAGGIDTIYPTENTALARQIARKGLRLSAEPLGTRPVARHFPARNRLVSGLGQASVLIEAALKSGSQKAAREAAEMGRDVLAVPGHPFDARAAAGNALIRDGATLVRGARDVIEALSPIAAPVQQKLTLGDPVTARLSQMPQRTEAPNGAHPSHDQILGQLGNDPVALDHLVRTLKTSTGTLSQVLSELELTGKVRRHIGGLFSLTR